MVRAVLLDAMGTLIELEPPAPRLQAELRQRAGLAITETEAQAGTLEEIAFDRAHHCQGRDRASLFTLRRESAGAPRDALPGTAASSRSAS